MKKTLSFVYALFFFQNISAQPCPYDNTINNTWAAPTTLGDSVISYCTYAGDFNRVTGMVAGNTYLISTCSNNSFDTQLSVYISGGTLDVAFNDDFCGTSSAIYFTPIVSGDFDILLDEYGCISNSTCMDMMVQLIVTPRPVITIPTVVHVVYNTSAENISDAQIQSQIDVLNEDFRRDNLNDIFNAPSVFRGVSIDPRIEFCLAQRDPNGNSTDGIIRTFTTHTDFNMPFPLCDATKCLFQSNLGGQDEWDKTQYLNIWVCNMTGDTFASGFIGFGFPASALLPPIFQGLGVVLDYRVTGTIGTATPPNNLGRLGTHEVGHWLGLWHLWGMDDNINECSSDSVFDTPPQDESSGGIPTFPQYDFCSIKYPGIMFNNFMDYTDDAGKNMFTFGQSGRMDYSMFVPYLSLQTSQGCTPPTGIKETELSNTILVYPNPFTHSTTIEIQNSKLHPENFGSELRIYDVLGQAVYQQTLNSKQETLNLNLPSGIYFYKLLSSSLSFGEGRGEVLANGKLIIQ